MKMSNLEAILAEHPFFAGCPPAHIAQLVGCASNHRFAPDTMLYREGEEATQFFIIREGSVAIELHIPGRGKVCLQTLGTGDILGWSWLIPPFQYDFDARVLEVTRAIALDAVCMRGKCDADPVLGYDLLRRFSTIIVERLRSTRMRLLDIYGEH